jgi:hypothetical protein
LILIFGSVRGSAVALLVEELRYKPEGRGFDYRLFHWNFSGRTMAVSLCQK